MPVHAHPSQIHNSYINYYMEIKLALHRKGTLIWNYLESNGWKEIHVRISNCVKETSIIFRELSIVTRLK